MVTRPFSSVIGMSYIDGFKNRFFISWANVDAKKFCSPEIDNPFIDGFWTKISISFFRQTKEEMKLELDGYILGPIKRHPIFF